MNDQEISGSDLRWQDEVSSLRTQYWLAGVRRRLRPTSLDDLARLVEPELQWSNHLTGERSRPNKWRAYERGERSPRKSLVDEVEKYRDGNLIGAGTKAEFEHVLWDVLRDLGPSPLACRRWLGRLTPEVRAISDRLPAFAVGKGFAYEIPRLRQREFQQLRCRPGLDALALLTFVVRQGNRFGLTDAAHYAGRWLVSALWHLSLDVDDRGLLVPFFSLFERRVMPMTRHGAHRLTLGDDVSARTSQLRQAVRARLSAATPPQNAEHADVEIRRILRYDLTAQSPYSAKDLNFSPHLVEDVGGKS